MHQQPCNCTTRQSCTEIIQDGGFEQASFTPGSYTSATDGMTLDGGHWTVHTDGSRLANGFASVGVINDYLSLFYKTPDGNNFVYIGYYPTGGGNAPPYPACSIVQTITLQGGRHYKLSLLESAYKYTGDNTPGSIKVQILPASGPPIYTKSFSVPAYSNWVPKQDDDVFIPPTAGGSYQIVLSNDVNSVAVIDAVSLCEQN